MQNQLKQIGEEILDKFVITKVLMCNFVSTWESSSDEKQNIDNLVAGIFIEGEM